MFVVIFILHRTNIYDMIIVHDNTTNDLTIGITDNLIYV